MGTTSQWENLMVNGVFTGQNATRKLQEIFNSKDSVIHGDVKKKPSDRLQHFWPFGLNYNSEYKTAKDAINHCLIVNEIYKDLFPSGTIVMPHEQQQISITVRAHADLNITFTLLSTSMVEAAVFNTRGEKIATYPPQTFSTGEHRSTLDLSNIPNGRYIYKVIAGENKCKGIFSFVQ